MRARFLTVWQGDLLGVGDTELAVESSGAMDAHDEGFVTPTVARSYQIGVASLMGEVYLTQQADIDYVYSWDGSTFSNVPRAVLDGTAGQFPAARSVVSLHERVFAGNVRAADNTEFRSRVHWSDVLDPEVWKALSYIDVAPDDGTEITCLRAFGDTVLVFKEHSLFLLSGVDESTFTLFPVDPNIGTTAPDTVVVEGGIVLFLEPERGVLAFNGQGFEPLDRKINRYLLDSINHVNVHKAVAKVYRNRYYLSYPSGSSSVNDRTLVLDLRTGAWTEYSWASTAFAVSEDALFGAPEEDHVWRMEVTDLDGDKPIDGHFQTAWIAPAGFGTLHRARRADFAFSTALPHATVEVGMQRNMGSAPYRSNTLDVTALTPVWGGMVWGEFDWGVSSEGDLLRRTGWGDRWRTARWKISTRDDVELSGFTVQISIQPRQRGERF